MRCCCFSVVIHVVSRMHVCAHIVVCGVAQYQATSDAEENLRVHERHRLELEQRARLMQEAAMAQRQPPLQQPQQQVPPSLHSQHPLPPQPPSMAPQQNQHGVEVDGCVSMTVYNCVLKMFGGGCECVCVWREEGGVG